MRRLLWAFEPKNTTYRKDHDIGGSTPIDIAESGKCFYVATQLQCLDDTDKQNETDEQTLQVVPEDKHGKADERCVECPL